MAPNWTAIARPIGLLGSDYESEVFAAAKTRRRCLKAELRMVIRFSSTIRLVSCAATAPRRFNVKAIPTKYRDLTMCPRLEARWAELFTQFGWTWYY